MTISNPSFPLILSGRHCFLFLLFTSWAAGLSAKEAPLQHIALETSLTPPDALWLTQDQSRIIASGACAEGSSDLCGMAVVCTDPQDPRAQTFGDPIEGAGYSEIAQPLYLQLGLTDVGTVDAVTYFGANLDEAVDLAIGAVFSSVEMADLAWFLARADVGKTSLSSEEIWRWPDAKRTATDIGTPSNS